MNSRTRRLRSILLVLAAVIVVGLALAADAANVLRRADLSTVNIRFDVRGERPAPELVVVAIEDRTLTAADGRYPLDRRWHAQVIRRLTKAGAKVIAYDVQFTSPSGDLDADNALILATRAAAPRVVMATTEVERGGRTQIFGGRAGLRISRATPSNSNYSNDVDGRIRRMAFELQDLETFPMAAARLALGRRIELPQGSTAWIDYPGSPGTIRQISFRDVQRGRFDPEDVRGKIVVVGGTAPSLQDRHATSTSHNELMAGPEIQAAAILTALRGFPLSTGPGWINVLLVVLCGAIVPLAALRLRVVYAALLGVITVAAVLVGAQLAFNEGTIVTVVYAIAAAIAGLLATGAIHTVTVAFERAHTRDAFARFVPESVVDEVLRSAEGVRLGGVRGEATVMFSDLRGFTSFAETLEPEQVIAALNRYLTAMSEAILDHGGTLVAYMGDGIMAVFGAPLTQEDHADRALAAARDMLDRLEGFNRSLRDEGLHEGFKMGIGLNSGPVMSGNVGSERRLEYTALGDTTNTAARLEGMTKGTPHQLFLADSTRDALLQRPDDLIEVGEFEVRGRKATIKLWSLRESEPEPPAPAADEPSAVAAPADAPRR
jgi:adenylate cyclase